ncbi:hypothetical protein C884_00578 [Kocuria palustris PEL]|uniref:Uncharacterized protein n=1 Tax=Kocuria palustris PEL TaxID=1236550 RepID=M2WCU5_9MICC|nr:hypothetical protein C884_00578 [Kocuria palustris PEL]
MTRACRDACATGPVLTQGTPPRKEGCRPASWGLSLALVTCLPFSDERGSGANPRAAS